MTLQELGEALRSAREKRELSIEDVAAYLKLSTNQITAIEEGNIAAFPHISAAIKLTIDTFKNASKVGIIAGASTSNDSINEVVDFLNNLNKKEN